MSEFLIRPRQRVVLIGDSITDAGRREDPNGMGSGYAMFVACWITARYPDLEIEFFNRGIGGDTVSGLEARWHQDCLDLRPNWVSILVGINETAQQGRGLSEYTVEGFETGYRRLLDQVRDQTGARLLLMDPFLVGGDEERRAWRPLLEPRIAVVHRLAERYDALLIETDQVFAGACRHRPAEFWAPDAVHPTPPGHALIAQHWLAAVGA